MNLLNKIGYAIGKRIALETMAVMIIVSSIAWRILVIIAVIVLLNMVLNTL